MSVEIENIILVMIMHHYNHHYNYCLQYVSSLSLLLSKNTYRKDLHSIAQKHFEKILPYW